MHRICIAKKQSIKKRNKDEGVILLDFKSYYRVIIIAQRDIGILIEIYQWNKIESIEIDSNIYPHTDNQFSIKMQREEGRNCLFQQSGLEQLGIHIQKINFNPYLKLYQVVTENGLYTYS